jgi:hypothetical protein
MDVPCTPAVRVTAVTERRLSIAVLGVAAVVMGALVITRLDYVPIWDGRIYAGCISAAAQRFTLASLRCAGHASQAYAALAALVQMVAPESPVPLVVTNTGLFALACMAFHRLTRLVFPAVPSVDRALLTAAFVVHPVFLSAVVQPSLDLPLLPAFLWSTVFVLERRWVPLVLAGVAMAFTKETGVLLYAVLLACYALWFELRPKRPAADRIKALVRLGPLAFPGVAFVAYLFLHRLANPAQSVIWYTGTTSSSLLGQFLVPRLDLYQVNYAVLLLVLNFAWLPSIVTGMDAFVGIVRAGHREPARTLPGTDRHRLGFLILVTLTACYALTRFTTFGHTRYFLVLYALLLVPFFAALVRLGVGATARRVILCAYAGALAVSVVRTIDPVSRRLYGTFAFGTHQMLRMTRVTRECCGFGQDQLAYSLEFTTLQPLTDSALATIVTGPSTVLVVPDSTSWIFLDPPDTDRSRRFAYRTGAQFTPNVLEHSAVAAGKSRLESAYYLALPYGDNARAFRELAPLYEFRDERRFERNGYSLSTYRLLPRRAPQP